MSYPTSQGSLHIGTCPCDGCNPEVDRDELAREREQNLVVDLVCDDCGFTYTGETDDGEPEACVHCSSENVSRWLGEAA